MSSLRRVVCSVKIYLAGNQGARNALTACYLAGKGEEQYVTEGAKETLKVFLAEIAPWRNEGLYDATIKEHRPYILESFYYCNADTERLMPYFGDFLLDSGAFTFMQGKVGSLNWDEYVERYAAFINKNKVEKFFELDIDSVVGYKKVKEFRNRLTKMTGKQPIPVWHNNRGKDEFIRHCEEFGYVSIGGLVGGASEYSSKYWKFFPWFINTAHEHGAKIHALGFTSLKGIETYHFDSVDSTAWVSGNRYGFVYLFDGKTLLKKNVPKGHRLGDSRRVALHNYMEWIKFQKYADKHL